jgi:hypothetical protein
VAEPKRESGVLSGARQRSLRFVVALGLVIYEAVIYQGPPRWVLLGVYLTMMGLPIAEWGDELRTRATAALDAKRGDEAA